MSNDNKTLADAQPGGRVRLGDRNDALAASLRQIADAQYTRRQRFNGRLPADVQEVIRMAAAALSAQPSPGGQGDAPLRVFSAGRWTYDGTGQTFSHEDMDAAAFVVYRDALAARQPVGDAITVEAVATVRRNGDGDRYIDWLTEGGIADLEVGDVLMVSDRAITDEDGSGEVYAAPPAQAVDLGAVRKCADEAVEFINHGYGGHARRKIQELLTLTDSQAVSNG
ncbi:hypothetical protein I5U59_03155 [Stenotrophomonas maltophilia]|nr:hypothetical protein [Stenotrophomonas maltophilia]MBH1502070.1 hypothetical protein [Stenotrophomonas maltophilia]